MTCPFGHDDAAYVLGALSPTDRLAFERHLAGCEECNRAVRDVAGLPGLLARVDASVLEQEPIEEPLPETLLPSMSRALRRSERRRTYAMVGASAAAAAVLVGGAGLALAQLDDDPGTRAETPSADAGPLVAAQPMEAVGEVPVRARVRLEPVTWGTRVDLTCTYEPDSVEYELPPAVDYTLFVRARDGHTEQIGSWRSQAGGPMRIVAATATRAADLSSVEVRTPRGDTVLQLAP
ncbi:MAG TPA: zf-HC2 domain-containing protein [Marmoricola sp.]|nr:zf-HC2 domain-containing protein [Marmoricola sp.]